MPKSSDAAMMQEWLDSIAESARPMIERVYDAIEAGAQTAFDERDPLLLPTTRGLATELGETQNTIQVCVARLRAAGRVRVAARNGRKTYLAPGRDDE